MGTADEHFAANAEMDDEELRWATESGEWQIQYYRNRMEECRIAMLEARHKFWMTGPSSPIEKWRPIRDAYWTALDNWQAAQRDLWQAKENAKGSIFAKERESNGSV